MNDVIRYTYLPLSATAKTKKFRIAARLFQAALKKHDESKHALLWITVARYAHSGRSCPFAAAASQVTRRRLPTLFLLDVNDAAIWALCSLPGLFTSEVAGAYVGARMDGNSKNLGGVT
jgi:hypothetical protein